MKINELEKSTSMNEIKFRNLPSNERITWLNQRLKDTGKKVEEISKEIGISSSSVSYLMKEDGCRYSRTVKQYLPIVEKIHDKKANQQEFLDYLLANAETIQKLIDESSSKQLIFDESIYQTDDSFMSKTMKVKTNTFNDFQKLLKEKFPHFRFQDILTQALIDFIKKYK